LNISTWSSVLVCVSLIAYVLLRRSWAVKDEFVERLAGVVGARRAWGESDASLRRRSIALSRWPYEQQAPVLAAWARVLGRIGWRGERKDAGPKPSED
jgi:hypothetical protein